MKKYILKFAFLAIAGFLSISLITSCSESDELDLVSVEDYVDETVFNMEAQGKIGRHGCYHFMFPITIEFSGGSTATVVDYEALRTVIREWKENNPDADREDRPQLAFPLEVISQDGEIMSVESKEELRALRRECIRDYYDKPWRRARRFFRTACFDLQFPLTIEFPNGSILEAATPQTLKNALRAWRRSVDNPEGHPTVVFPVTVVYEDGSTAEAGSKEELKELKDQCAEEDNPD